MNRVSSSAIYDYDFMDQIGVGSFGCVYRARHKLTNSIVAVKVMKKKGSKSSGNSPWQEYKTMKRLAHHPNIIHLFEGFTGPTKELYFVMEFMNGGNLYQYLEEKKDKCEKLKEMEIRPVLQQILNALESIHEQGYFHRDLKPENLLVNVNQDIHGSTQLTIKLADFGLARELKSKAPYTDYVSTRWYRSPEVLLKSATYSSSVDIWAVGVIMAELLTLHPLFPGQSEIDQLFRICEVIGSPASAMSVSGVSSSSSSPSPKKKKIRGTGFSRKKSELALSTHDPVTSTNDASLNNVTGFIQGDGGEWKEGVRLANKLGFQFPQVQPKGLATVLPTASNLMIDLMRRLLLFDPKKRLSARDALGHPFFIDTLESTPTPTTPNRPNSEQLQFAAAPSRSKTTRTVSMIDFSQSLPSEHLPVFLDPLSFIPLSLDETTNLDDWTIQPFTPMVTQDDTNDDLKKQTSMDSYLPLDMQHNSTFDNTLADYSGNPKPTMCRFDDKCTQDLDNKTTYEPERWAQEKEYMISRHNRHDSLDLLDTLAIPPVPLNLRPSFSSPLNHMDHLYQQRHQNQKQHPHHLPAGKQKKSTFTQLFGLRKKSRQAATSQQKPSSHHENKQIPGTNAPTHPPSSSASTKLQSTSITGIPRTESFSSLLKQITSSSTSAHTTKKLLATENEETSRHKLLQRRSPSISLLNTYYHDTDLKEKPPTSRNFWSRKHAQPIEDTL